MSFASRSTLIGGLPLSLVALAADETNIDYENEGDY